MTWFDFVENKGRENREKRERRQKRIRRGRENREKRERRQRLKVSNRLSILCSVVSLIHGTAFI